MCGSGKTAVEKTAKAQQRYDGKAFPPKTKRAPTNRFGGGMGFVRWFLLLIAFAQSKKCCLARMLADEALPAGDFSCKTSALDI